MAHVEILDTEQRGLDPERRCGGSIDVPRPGTTSGSYAFALKGWALGAYGQPAEVEVRCGDILLAATRANLPRLDVGDHLPHLPQAGLSGFAVTISALDLPADFEFTVEVSNPVPRVVIGRVRGRRSTLPADLGAGLQPIMLTTLGRTGSSVLMSSLRAHPEVLCHGLFPYETRQLSYWSSVFAALSTPSGAVQPVATRGVVPYWWLGDPAQPVHDLIDTDEAYGWLLGDGIDAIASVCRDRVTAFYDWFGSRSGRPAARFFVEKMLPLPDIQARAWEWFPHGREVFLVRDPRDMIASIFAFNRKRGDVRFGREVAENDVAYVDQVRDAMVALLQAWRRRRARAHLIHYEALMLRNAATLEALFSYLGVDASSAAVEAVIRDVATDESALVAAHRTVADPAATVGRWRTDLAPDVLAATEDRLGDVIRAFGYDDVAMASR